MRICPKNLTAIAEYAWNGRVVVVDTETTGGGADDEICQIAAAEYVSGALKRTMNVYLNPTCGMNPWAEAIHGLSLDFLAEHGIDPAEGMRRFLAFLGSDALFVAHNVPFDKGMIRRECRKFGVVCAPTGIETCDTVVLSRRLRPDLGSHRLCNLIRDLGLDAVNSHDALDDVMACAGVFFRLLSDLKESLPAEIPMLKIVRPN